MRGIRQEVFPRRNRFQDAVFAFLTKRFHGDAAHGRYEKHPCRRAVGCEIVSHEDPARLGVTRDGLFDRGCEVSLIARLLDGRCDHLAGCNLEVADECLRAVPLVLELVLLRMAWNHGSGRSNPFDRLNTGLLIDAHRVNSLLFQPW